MQYAKLGTTGLEVSRICLGCMSFGVPARGNHEWTLDEDAARPLIRQALEAGINFLDTANVYSDGTSEEIVGRALKDYARRDEIVLATKVHGRMHEGPNGGGLSRKAIMTEIDQSLRRLGTDYVDLYQIHRFDPQVPVEETMEALHDVVKAGKARYIGASSMYAWQFSKAQYTARLNGWTRFVSMQNHYNLLYREEEREMLPLCADQGVGVLPWSPLARGRLHPRLGRGHRPQPHGQLRPHPVPRGRPPHRRGRRRDRRRTRAAPGPDRAGLAAAPAHGDRPRRRRHQARARRGRRRRARRRAVREGPRAPGAAVRAPRDQRSLTAAPARPQDPGP